LIYRFIFKFKFLVTVLKKHFLDNITNRVLKKIHMIFFNIDRYKVKGSKINIYSKIKLFNILFDRIYADILIQRLRIKFGIENEIFK